MKMFVKWAIPGLFLFTFALFKHKLFKKLIHYADFSGIRTRIFGEEGQPFDHHHSPCLMKMPKNSEPTFHNFEGVKKAWNGIDVILIAVKVTIVHSAYQSSQV